MLLEIIIKHMLIEECEKNNDIFSTCKLIENEFPSVKTEIKEYEGNYEIIVRSCINNNIITKINKDKK
jgi:hypothetical protein